MSEEHVDPIDYAMDALDDVARRRADRHLDQCPQCRAEVAQWQETASLLAESTPPAMPSAGLRQAVLGAAARTPQDGAGAPSQAPSRAVQPAQQRLPHPARWLLVAAAAVVLVAGGVTVAARPWSQTPAVSAVQHVTSAPDARRTSAPVDGGTLVMVFSSKQEKAVATLQHVPPTTGGKVYQAWLITPSGMVNAGLLQPGKPTVLRGSIADAKGAAVTVEPAGGSRQPTTPPIVSIFMS